MANRYATKTGNWSDVTVWDGGTDLPTTGDTVRPNTYTVTIDQDITVTLLTNNASAPASAGGSFTVSSGTRVITAAITAYTATVFTTSGSAVVTVIGNVTASNSNQNANGITHGSSGLLTVQGIVASSSQQNSRGIQRNSSGNLTIVGDVKGGTTHYADGVYNNYSGGTITITGNVSNQATNYSFNYGVYLYQPCTLTVTGSVTGNSGDNTSGISGSSNGGSTITITGNLTPGTGQNADALKIVHTSDNVTVNGIVYGSTGNYGGYGINSQLGNITIIGNVIGRATTAIYKSNNNGGVYIVTGNLYGGWNNGASGLSLNSNITSLTIFGNCYGGANYLAAGISINANVGTVIIYGDAIGLNGGGNTNGNAAGITITGSSTCTLILNGYAIGNDFGAGNGTYKAPGIYNSATNGANVKVYVKGVKNGPYGMSGVIGPIFFLSKRAPYYCTSTSGRVNKVKQSADRDFSLHGKIRKFRIGA